MHPPLGRLRRSDLLAGLRSCPLFAESPADVLDELAGLTAVRTLAAGAFLFHEHAQVGGLFIVRRGSLKLHRVSAAGREVVIHIFRAGESLGEESLFSAAGCLASACATEPTQVLVVSKEAFLALLASHPELSLNLLRGLDRHFSLLVARIDELTRKDVPTRVVDWLLQHCPDPTSREPQTVFMTATKRLLASELGTCGETLSRTLARLRNQRLLSVRGRAVTLNCPRRLAQLFQGTGKPGTQACNRSSADSAVGDLGRGAWRACGSQLGRVCTAA